MEDRRRFSRVKFVADVQVAFEGHQYEAELLDVSLKGALLQFKSPAPLELSLGDRCKLHFRLVPSDIALHFEMELVHQHDGHYGFRFESEDLDSITHLRRLLELNVGDDAPITGELPFLSGE